jgi:D-xylose transport system substrate-binding protein
LPAKALVETAEGDEELQLRPDRELLDSGVRVLVLVAHDAESAVNVVKADNAKEVPVLCYERPVRDADIDAIVGVQVAAIGLLEAHQLYQLAPQGNSALIAGSPRDTDAKTMPDAQLNVLQPVVDRGDIQLVREVWAKDGNPLEALAHLEEAMEATGGSIIAVVASNDGAMGGAIQTWEEHTLTGKVLIAGQDADLEAIVRILDGRRRGRSISTRLASKPRRRL